MIFVIGDRGTAKTSTILQSGIEPELLAGQVYQDNAVTPTRTANIFYARGTVFVEAGGAVLGNPQAWSRLVAKLQPGKLKSLGGGQAPRGVMLCFDLETFTRPGAAEAIANAARYLQARLGEISQILGVSFPVYVLFTRADRLPYFAEFVRNLSNEEAGQVVGATLPMRPANASGVYGEEENQRLSAAFNQLFHTFCDQRLRLLPRETDAEKLPQAYEFPREFRKLRSALVQFLVDIGRPSQLRSSPFLRGFYFSGVRPVTMTEVPAAPLATPAEQAELGGATGMFRAGLEAQRRSQQAQAAPGGGSRKVPQWLFLGHLFNDVILADEAARRASGSSTKTSTLKRALFATAAGLCLLYAILLLVSFFGNRSLEQKALDASRNLTGIAAGNAVPSEDSLRKLDTLRQSLAELTDYEYNGAPLRLRWGLYSGSSVLPSVRRVYYSKFNQLLFGSTEAGILAFLQRTPAAPGPSDDYGYGYDSLKSYLLTTSEWKRSSDQSLQDFLASRLRARWSSGRENEIGQARMDLAKLQFDFYAQDLQHGNPYSADNDSAAVDRTRSYLSKFSGVQRVYQFLLAESAKKNPPTNFNRKFPGTADAVTSTVEVAWAFTRDGWKFMQDQIKRQNFGGEQWVLGPYQSQGVDRAAMETRHSGSLYQGLHRTMAQRSPPQQREPLRQLSGRVAQADAAHGQRRSAAGPDVVDLAEYRRRSARRRRQVQGCAGRGAALQRAAVHRAAESKLQRRPDEPAAGRGPGRQQRSQRRAIDARQRAIRAPDGSPAFGHVPARSRGPRRSAHRRTAAAADHLSRQPGGRRSARGRRGVLRGVQSAHREVPLQPHRAGRSDARRTGRHPAPADRQAVDVL